MATSEHISALRVKLQDRYDQNGNLLTTAQQAFKDDELNILLDDAAYEATDGDNGSDSIPNRFIPLMVLLARADGLLMLAQDEARRIKWTVNNKVMDPSVVSPNLRLIAKELRLRYDKAKDRELERQVEGIENRNSSGKMTFNSSVKGHYERDFNNTTVKRNPQNDHY